MKDRMRMPTSHAGITQYFEDYKSKLELKPELVVVMCVVVIIVELLLKVL